MPTANAKDVPEMSEHNTQNGAKPQETPEGITKITVGGFKSIAQEQSIEVRPLTILAGANSSGKSSIMQPLLLLKQTIQATYNPGALLLDGPNVQFTSADQLLSVITSQSRFLVGYKTSGRPAVAVSYERQSDQNFDVANMIVGDTEQNTFTVGMTHHEILRLPMLRGESQLATMLSDRGLELSVARYRGVLAIALQSEGAAKNTQIPAENLLSFFGMDETLFNYLPPSVYEIIHLPGLRGNPRRTYPVAAFGSPFPGTFENYTASVIARWQFTKQSDTLAALTNQLSGLGLTDAVTSNAVDATQLEIRVSRAPYSGAKDMVSIADVGLGVSQTLPVLVALLAAKPGQLVYLEQPEIHLHPRAQTAMAQVLADAAMRGVRVIAETHSSLLLLGIQTLVAEGKLPPELVKLHWFTRGDDGATTIRSADLDETGAFGDWPEDFDDVTLNAQSRYLDAAEQRMAVK